MMMNDVKLPSVPAPTLPARLGIALLRIYQVTLSPLFHLIGVRCRHGPSCSNYGVEAMRRHGLWRGGWLTLARLLRCHPFGSSGFDPVPEHLDNHFWQPWKYGDWRWRKRG
jgi:uncharacterized protein